MTSKFGTVEHNGTTITLTEEATSVGGDMRNLPQYSAAGVDDQGNEVRVFWNVKQEFLGYDDDGFRWYWLGTDVEEADLCDWDEPVEVQAA
jgi:hypothetical protein